MVPWAPRVIPEHRSRRNFCVTLKLSPKNTNKPKNTKVIWKTWNWSVSYLRYALCVYCARNRQWFGIVLKLCVLPEEILANNWKTCNNIVLHPHHISPDLSISLPLILNSLLYDIKAPSAFLLCMVYSADMLFKSISRSTNFLLSLLLPWFRQILNWGQSVYGNCFIKELATCLRCT